MGKPIGIRREDKSKWERRAPLVPADVAGLAGRGIDIRLQPSPVRAFPEPDYTAAGARLAEDLSGCGVILGIKEVPQELLFPGMTYVFFSHTIKGQSYNMPMLRRLVELNCTLIDYERIVDAQGRRLIFFGRHAGYAGMIETLHALSGRLRWEGIADPFEGVLQPYQYPSLEAAKKHLASLGRMLAEVGLPEEISPLVFGFTGYGNVSLGAQEVFDVLPHREVTPAELAAAAAPDGRRARQLIKVVFHEKHLAEREDGGPFVLQDYYDHPEQYRGIFQRHLPHLDVLVNGIFWTERYPRLVSLELLEQLGSGAGGRRRPRVIGDISCDIGGSIQATVKATQPDVPAYVYEPGTGQVIDGVGGDGPVIMAVDNLPCELPREASEFFSRTLREFVPALAELDTGRAGGGGELPDPLKKALILYRGEFTPDYRHMQAYR